MDTLSWHFGDRRAIPSSRFAIVSASGSFLILSTAFCPLITSQSYIRQSRENYPYSQCLLAWYVEAERKYRKWNSFAMEKWSMFDLAHPTYTFFFSLSLWLYFCIFMSLSLPLSLSLSVSVSVSVSVSLRVPLCLCVSLSLSSNARSSYIITHMIPTSLSLSHTERERTKDCYPVWSNNKNCICWS